MHRLLIFSLLLILFVTAKAQKNYAEAIQQGDAAFNTGQYKTAINKYFAAEAFNPDKKNEVKEKVNRVFNRIEALRIEADSTKILALKDKERALKAEKEQAIQKEMALAQNEKFQTLNSLMKYNNKQVFELISLYETTLLDLKVREYNLSMQYNSLTDSTYRFFSFYDISTYYERNKKMDDALSWADSMCFLYPDSALSFQQRGVVNYYRANWTAALLDVDKALSLNPKFYDLPLLNWDKALILCNLGRYEDSRKYIKIAIGLLAERDYDESWVDKVVQPDIEVITNIKSIYMSLNEQIKAMDVYATVNNIYAGSASINTLENMATKKLPINILLSIINYATVHLDAIPNDYIGYLVNGYFWEMADYPKLAEKNYRLFLKKNSEQQNKKYNQYKNNFNSPVFNKLKN